MMEACFAGIDVGTSYVKAVVINGECGIVGSRVERSGSDLQASIDSAYDAALKVAGLTSSDVRHIIATGFGREKVKFAHSTKTEISCHAKGAFHHFPRRITIIDIGGQDTKIIRIDDKGKRVGFKMNRKCAAGTGAFLEEIARRLELPMDEMNTLANRSSNSTPLGSYCTVFASTEVLTRIKEGEKKEDMVKSAFESVARRVIEMDVLEGVVVMTGGVVAYNDVILRILANYTREDVLVPPEPQLIGAFGAALYAKENYNPGP